MAEIYHINDLLHLKQHAQSQGYSMQEYLRKAERAGMTTEQVITAAKDNILLDDMITDYDHEQRIQQRTLKRRQGIKKIMKGVGVAATSLATLYALNFGVMKGIAEASVDKGFKQRLEIVERLREKMHREEERYYGKTSGEMLTESNFYSYSFQAQSLQTTLEPQIWDYSERMSKAKNPLLHVKNILKNI